MYWDVASSWRCSWTCKAVEARGRDPHGRGPFFFGACIGSRAHRTTVNAVVGGHLPPAAHPRRPRPVPAARTLHPHVEIRQRQGCIPMRAPLLALLTGCALLAACNRAQSPTDTSETATGTSTPSTGTGADAGATGTGTDSAATPATTPDTTSPATPPPTVPADGTRTGPGTGTGAGGTGAGGGTPP
jgi:hypothetical protein